MGKKFRYSLLIFSILLFISCGVGGGHTNVQMVANAGDDKMLTLSSLVKLDASKSTSPDKIKYSWEIFNKPLKSKATLSDKNIPNPTVFIDVDGDYVFKLIISNDKESKIDGIKITLNSSCSFSSKIEFKDMEKNTFEPWIEGIKNDVNTTFVYFNRIKNATRYEYSVGVETNRKLAWTNIDADTRVVFQFKYDTSIKSRIIRQSSHDSLNNTIVVSSIYFDIGSKVIIRLVAFDEDDTIIATSKKVNFIIGNKYIKNPFNFHFTKTTIDDEINMQWCPTNSVGEYFLYYGSSLGNLKKRIRINTPLDLKASFNYIDEKYIQYFSLSQNSIFSKTIKTTPLYNTKDMNFKISKVTFNQSVQIDMENNVNNTPIIADKVGILRVFVDVKSRFSSHKVVVKLSAKSNGEELEPILQTVIVSNSGFDTSDSTNRPIVFHINNPDYLKVGTEFYVEIDPENEIPESNEDDNRYPKESYKSFGFENASKMKVVLVPINSIYKNVNISNKHISHLSQYLLSMYPLSSVDVSIGKPINLGHEKINNFNDLSDILSSILKYKDEQIILNERNKAVHYVGIVDNVEASQLGGAGFINTNEDISLVSAVRINKISVIDFAEVIAHEIGHNHGLNHISGKDSKLCITPSTVDEKYPYNNAGSKYAKIGKTSYVAYRNILYDKDIYRDIMSYCQDKWISDYSYNKIYHFKRKLDETYSRSIQDFTSLNHRSIKPLINGRVIIGRLDGDLWNITKKYLSQGEDSTIHTKTNFYIQITLEDGSKLKIPLYLKSISHSDVKIFKVFIPSIKGIKSAEILDTLHPYQASYIIDLKNKTQ